MFFTGFFNEPQNEQHSASGLCLHLWTNKAYRLYYECVISQGRPSAKRARAHVPLGAHLDGLQPTIPTMLDPAQAPATEDVGVSSPSALHDQGHLRIPVQLVAKACQALPPVPRSHHCQRPPAKLSTHSPASARASKSKTPIKSRQQLSKQKDTIEDMCGAINYCCF